MTIRYQCPECDSVLKIKDELAGTDGKCPKCKTKFVVPPPEEQDTEADSPGQETATDSSDQTDDSAPVKEKSSGKNRKEEKAEKRSKPEVATAVQAAADDDFDAAAFLMEEGPGPKASAGLSTPSDPKPQGPATDKQGRRLYTSSGGSKARAASMSAAAAAADEQINASANARDLLSKNMDESRVKASSMPMTEKKRLIDFDFAGAGRELVRYAPHVVGGLAGIVFLYWLMNSMVSQKIKLPELGKVSGTVTVNSEPLVGVAVKFTPLDDIRKDAKEGPNRVRTATGITDENGQYTLYYLDGVVGAPVGKGRLWIEVRSAKDLKLVPPEWSGPGPNIKEVKKTGNNREGEFDIVIKTGS